MNWSMTTWRRWTKSPNCASQRTSDSGAATESRTRRQPQPPRERRVVDLERGRGVERCWIGTCTAPFSASCRQVPVREGAALGVPAGESDRDLPLSERRERERLRPPPIDPPSWTPRRGAGALHQLGVRRKSSGPEEQLVVQPTTLGRNRGHDLGTAWSRGDAAGVVPFGSSRAAGRGPRGSRLSAEVTSS